MSMSFSQIQGHKIIRPLGEGGMAKVYLAQQGPQYFAIKLLTFNAKRFDMLLKRFHKEAGLASRMRHPHIIRVYDHGPFENTYFLLMEYIEGFDLRGVIDRPAKKGMDDPQLALLYTHQIAQALAYAHAEGVVHRDIKPANILIETKTHRAVLTDFGVAKMLENDWDLTATGMSVGTPNYMSLEQMSGDPLDGRSDIYALGVMLFELLTGTLPYGNHQSARQLQSRFREDPAKLPPELSGYQYLLDRMIAVDKEARFSSANMLLSALEHYLDKESLVWLRQVSARAGENQALDQMLDSSGEKHPREMPAIHVPHAVQSAPTTTWLMRSEKARWNKEATSSSDRVGRLKMRHYILLFLVLTILPLAAWFLYSNKHSAEGFNHQDTLSLDKREAPTTRSRAIFQKALRLQQKGYVFRLDKLSALSVLMAGASRLRARKDQQGAEAAIKAAKALLVNGIFEDRSHLNYYSPDAPVHSDIIDKLISLQRIFPHSAWHKLWRETLDEMSSHYTEKTRSNQASPTQLKGLYQAWLGGGERLLSAAMAHDRKGKDSHKRSSEMVKTYLSSGLEKATAQAYAWALQKDYVAASYLLSSVAGIEKHLGRLKSRRQHLSVVALWQGHRPAQEASKVYKGDLIEVPAGCYQSRSIGRRLCFKTFYLSKEELSMARYQAYLDEVGRQGNMPTPSSIEGPLVGLSYNQVGRFIHWLNGQLKQGHFRLPTEWEWEYSAQLFAPSQTQRVCDGCDRMTALTPFPVKDRKEQGAMHHLIGNVWEMTCSAAMALPPSKKTTNTCDEKAKEHVVRGGSFHTPKGGLGGDLRFQIASDIQSEDLGARLVWVPTATL